MRYRVNRSDNGSKELIQYAKDLGFTYMPINGVVDGVLAWGHRTVVVDFKSKGGTLTPNQQRLVATGFPVTFLTTPAQLDALRAELQGAK